MENWSSTEGFVGLLSAFWWKGTKKKKYNKITMKNKSSNKCKKNKNFCQKWNLERDKKRELGIFYWHVES